MNIQDATKLQDLFLQIEDIEAKDALLVILTKLADRDKLPNDFNIFEDNIQDIKDTGFVKTEKLDDFIEEQAPEILTKKPITKEEQEDIDIFTKDLMQEPSNTKPVEAKKKSKEVKKVKLKISKEDYLLMRMGVYEDFLKKYNSTQLAQISMDVYNNVEQSYGKDLDWKMLNKKFIAMGYNLKDFKPKIRLAYCIAKDKGYL